MPFPNKRVITCQALRSLAFLYFSLSAFGLTPIVYNASDFTGTTNNLPVTLTSLMKVQVNNRTMLVGLPINFTPTNGTYTTNVYAGIYNLTIQGIPSGVTCLIPDTTNAQTLATCVISNLGLFSATNLNALITNPIELLGGTNIQMLTNGFRVTINGVVTNLNGMTINGAVLINPSISGLASNAIPGLNASNINSGTIAIINGGTGNSSGWAQGLSNSTDGTVFYWTNIANQIYLIRSQSPALMANYQNNGEATVMTPGPHNSGSGFFYPVQTTNYGLQFTPIAAYVNANGQLETNYIKDPFAMFVGTVPEQSGSSNSLGGNIGKGWGTIFMNGQIFCLGSFYSGNQEEMLVFNPTNFTMKLLIPQNTNYDGSGDNFAKYYANFDSGHTNIIFTNLNSFGVSAGNITIFGNGSILASGAAALTLPSATLSVTNAFFNQAGSATSDFQTIWEAPNAGGNPVAWFCGLRSGNARSLYWGSQHLVLWQMDESALHAMVPLQAASITSTNAPTFGTTNATPAGWASGTGATSPRIWLPFTNGTTVYYLPGY